MKKNNLNILSIIPARGGSKGIPRKNIICLGKKPLIAWTIEASLKSKFITKTIVSSDDDEILNISKMYNSDILKRPYSLSTDNAPSEAVIKHVLESLSEQYDYIILLQPTSPLRDFSHIDRAFKDLLKSNATALISTFETDNKILKSFVQNDDGYIKGISNDKYPFMRRQDLPKTYMSNGAIYIIKVDEFLKNNSLLTTKTISFIMDNISSLDIDTIDDINEVNKYLIKKI